MTEDTKVYLNLQVENDVIDSNNAGFSPKMTL